MAKKKKYKTALDYYNEKNNIKKSDSKRMAKINADIITGKIINPSAENKQEQINKKQQKKVKDLKKKVDEEKKELGIYEKYKSNQEKVKQNMFVSSQDRMKHYGNQSKNKKTVEQTEMENLKKAQQEKKEIDKLNKNYENTSETYKTYEDEKNRSELTRYLADQERVENEEVTTLDKFNILRPYLANLEDALDANHEYTLENGSKVSLPTYRELKSAKVQSEMGKIGQAIHSASSSLGSYTPAMATSLATSAIPYVGKPLSRVTGGAVTYATIYNSAKNRKLLEGYSEKEAENYAKVNASLETGLGMAIGGFSKAIGGNGTLLTKNLAKVSEKVIKNEGTRYFVSHLVAEEVEELTQMVLDPINEHITLGEHESISEALSTIDGDEATITALSTLFSIGLTEGPTALNINTLSKNIDAINNQYGTNFKIKTDSNQVVDRETNKDATARFEELRRQSKISKYQEQQITELETRAMQVESDYESGKITEEQYKEETQKISYEAKLFKQEQENNILNPITKIEVEKEILDEKFNSNQITEQEYDKQVAELDNKLKEIAGKEDNVKYSQNENQVPYQYEKSNNMKVDKLKQSASQYFDNAEDTHELINTYEKIIVDKNYNVLFDDTITNIKGESVNAKITTLENGEVEIKINPNSERAGEFLIMHEVTHAIEIDSLKQLVVDFAKQNKDFDKALTDLKQAYGTEDVSSEVLADISGQLLGNQEFINSLKMQNTPESKNIIKQIYESIVRTLNKLTTKGRYRNFVQDLETKWREAYQTQTNNLENTRYSIKTDENGNKYVNIDTNQHIFEGKNLKEQNKIAREYILATFREKGLITEGKEVKVNNKTATKYTNPKEKISDSKKKVKNRISTELDNLLSVSKMIKTEPDKKDHAFAKDGWEYYLTNFKINDSYFTGVINVGVNGTTRMLYDINQIKKTTQNDKAENTAAILIGSSFSDNNIPQNDKNVKSDISNNSNMQENPKNSQTSKTWQEHLEKNYEATGTRTNFSDIRQKTQETNTTEVSKAMQPVMNDIKTISNELKALRETLGLKESKVLNPNTIANITKEDANTTPKLPNKKVSTGRGKSRFADNIMNKTDMLEDTSKEKILAEDEVKYYEEVTNKESLQEAFDRLENGGASETMSWFNKDSKNADSTDVAEGWILMKQYQDNKDYDGMVQVAKKLREIGTKAGQTVQAFNIMERMTPEGMVKYAQSELDTAYENMIKNKSQEWIENNRDKFDLTPSEVEFIMNNMEEISTMEDGYNKKVKLAEIQKLMTDKLPPEKGAGIKAWMRISMLFNPKTQVRNILGNAIVAPVNMVGDTFASMVDRAVSKKTGVRTTGMTKLSSYGKGMREGAYQSYNDFKKGINTRNIQGDRFEIGEGKSFNDKRMLGKALNRVDNMLSFMLDAGDRTFYEASFTNSINNQLELNKTDVVTQDMIDIATTEALQRTWQDNNKFTKFVLRTRKGLNNLIGTENFGLGDVLIPFAKTPANLTKALIDYSPAGVIGTITSGINLKRSLNNGQYTAQMQHQFVQNLGKATAGTILYALGYALATSGVIGGEADEDKDVANFMKNTLGISNYSIKIGNKSFTYDWAQPVAGAFSTMANIVNSQNKEQALLESIVGNLDTAGAILLEQSFLQSINEVLNNQDGAITGLVTQVLELPSRAIPTFSKQIADLLDGTQRTSFEKGKPLQTAVNQAKAKIPGLSKTLAPSVDTLGRKIQKYGGNNSVFNVFFNPANVNSKNVSESAKEIYRLYQTTGNKQLMPRVAPYDIEIEGKKRLLTSTERANYQKQSGKIVEDAIKELLKSSTYKKLSDADKSKTITDIINYAYNKPQEKYGKSIASEYKNADKYVEKGGTISGYYCINNILKSYDADYEEAKDNLDSSSSNYSAEVEKLSATKRKNIINAIINTNVNKEAKAYLYGKYYGNPETINSIVNSGINFNEYLKFVRTEYTSDKDSDGDTIKNSRKNKIFKAINNLKLTKLEKAMLMRTEYTSFDDYNYEIFQYVNKLSLTKSEKQAIFETLGFEIRGGRVYW